MREKLDMKFESYLNICASIVCIPFPASCSHEEKLHARLQILRLYRLIMRKDPKFAHRIN